MVAVTVVEVFPRFELHGRTEDLALFGAKSAVFSNPNMVATGAVNLPGSLVPGPPRKVTPAAAAKVNCDQPPSPKSTSKMQECRCLPAKAVAAPKNDPQTQSGPHALAVPVFRCPSLPQTKRPSPREQSCEATRRAPNQHRNLEPSVDTRLSQPLHRFHPSHRIRNLLI